MNREIKFRAFSKKDNKMYFGRDVELYGSPITGRVLLSRSQERPHNEYDTDVELMQYTGLKDKNGTEIYDGDIFKVNGKTYFVEWNEDLCRFILTTGRGYNTINCMDLTCDTIYYEKVIGNIYENPELIK